MLAPIASRCFYREQKMRKNAKDVLVVGAITPEERKAISDLLGPLMVEFAHKLSLARRLMKKIHFRAVILWEDAKHFMRELADKKFNGKIIVTTHVKKEKRKKKTASSENETPVHTKVANEILKGVVELLPAM